MYSGTTLTNISGNLIGVHQKINRSARKYLPKISGSSWFPSAKSINHFEGKNGPDGVKVKGTYEDVVLHFYDPYDPNDRELLEHIDRHYKNLVKQLKARNEEKASFEAAWLAHCLVDGLTPAHHYPYESEMLKLRGGHETRDSVRTKMLARGRTPRETVRNNWMLWGAKGLVTTHSLFELGIAMTMAPAKIKTPKLSSKELDEIRKAGVEKLFIESARRIAAEFSYDDFMRRGWTPALAGWVRTKLVPEIVKVVALVWYMAAKEASSS